MRQLGQTYISQTHSSQHESNLTDMSQLSQTRVSKLGRTHTSLPSLMCESGRPNPTKGSSCHKSLVSLTQPRDHHTKRCPVKPDLTLPQVKPNPTHPESRPDLNPILQTDLEIQHYPNTNP